MTEPIPTPAPEAAPDAPRRSRKPLVLGIVAAVVLVLAGGAAFAWSKLSGGGAQPHDVLPSTTVAYARVDLDPSAGQKIALLKLIRKFPDLAKDLGITDADQDVRELIIDEIGPCDLDFAKDFEPWLGNRLGLGLTEDLDPVFALQVSDEKKARAGLDKAFTACGEQEPGVAFLDGYAIVAEEQATADAAVKAATTKPLADDAQFAKDLDELGEQGVASAWFEAEAVEAFAEGFLADAQAAGVPGLDAASLTGGAESGTFALRAGDTSLELTGVVRGDALKKAEALGADTLPTDTVVAFGAAGAGSGFAQDPDVLREAIIGGFTAGAASDPTFSGADPEALLAEFEEATGFDVVEDLTTLYGDRLVLAIGAANLASIPTLAGPADVASLDVGLQLTSDADKATDLAQRLADLAASVGIQLVVEPTDDGAVLATNAGAAKGLAGEGDLGSSDAFSRVVPDADTASTVLFVDADAIVEALLDAGPPPDVRDDIEAFEPLSAIGISSTSSKGSATFGLRVALDD